MSAEIQRIALFACTYREIDGVANTSRQFAAFATQRGLPFLLVHAGPSNDVVTDGSLTRAQLRRGRATFPLDGHHQFDLLFLRHYRKMERLLREFQPNFLHITGPSDVGILGAVLAHNLGIPLAASWQTNLHQFAHCRVSAALSRWPAEWRDGVATATDFAVFQAAARFYRIPRLLFAPNREMAELLEKTTGKPCFLMSHSVDTETFSPAFRDRSAGPFRIGYVGRLTPEKNVRWLAQIEQALLAAGHRNFRFVLIGQGAEEKWLHANLRQADFVGWMTGAELSREFANLDAFAFPSETDTFGLAVLEALSSGVPAVVSAGGGPKHTVEHGKCGYVASSPAEFAASLSALMTKPELHHAMRAEARRRALSFSSWAQIFAGMYKTYERYTHSAEEAGGILLEDATKIVNT